MKKLLALFLTVALLATLAVSVALTASAKVETHTVTFSVIGWGGSTSTSYVTTATSGNGVADDEDNTKIAAVMNQFNPSSGQIKGNQTTVAGNWQLWNTVEIPGAITGITLNFPGADATNYFKNNLYCAVSNESQGNVTSVDGLTAGTTSKSNITFAFDSADSNCYFKLLTDEKFTNGTVKGNITVTVTYEVNVPDDESSESDESSKAESSEEPSSEEPSSEPDESSEEPDGASDTYVLVESDDLKSGDKIILVAKDKDGKNFASGAFEQKYIKSAEVTVSEDNKIVVGSTSEVAPITLQKTEDGWTLNFGEKAICTDAAKALNIENKGSCYWTISIDEDTHIATVASAKDGCGRFLYNAQNPRFVNYTSNTTAIMILPQIYKLVENKEEEDVVVSLGSKVNEKTFSLRLGAKYNGKLLSADERASVQDLGIVFYPSKFLKAADALDLTTEGAAILSATGIDEDYYVDGQKFVDYETFVFYATIVDIPENGRNTNISFRPYIIYSEGTVYGEVLARNYNDTREAASRLAENQGENEITCPDNWFN